MEFSQKELAEAKRQIDSTLHKLRETKKTLESKEHVNRYKSQITLAKRRISAFEIANGLIEKELALVQSAEARKNQTQTEQGRIVIITGAPGTGKTTAATILAQTSDLRKSVHLHTDDFYHYLCKGMIPPHLQGSEEQNLIVIEAFLETAKRFARGGYDVIVDGIIGPWFLEPWIKTAREHYEVHYIILRADKDETMKRATGRAKLDRETNMELVEGMWEQFMDLQQYETWVIDTTKDSVEETVSVIKNRIREKTHLL